MVKIFFLLMGFLLMKKYYLKMIFIMMVFYMIFIIYFPINFTYFIYFFLMDFLSYSMILLTFFIFFLMFISSEIIFFKNYNIKYFSFILYLLLVCLLITFFMNNMLLFYLFFEVSLIPTLYLILGWGYQPERIQAGFYLFFYTLIVSLPLLIVIFYLFMNFNSLMFYSIYFINNFFIYFVICISFLVKMPMFLVHLWLPKAHVEAPISGSMILAGILLKLGGYGLIRFMKFILLMMSMNLIWISISLFGGFLISLSCLRQMDIKSLIAYSSVVHMSLVLGGLLTLFNWGINMCYFMMIAHGLCSSGLFCLANIYYERSMSRSMLINKGMFNTLPSMTFWMFLLSSSNMSSPPSLNLLSEIGLINSLISWSVSSFFLIFFLSFISSIYCLFLFCLSQHGKLNIIFFMYSMGSIREYLLLFLHWMPLNILFFMVNNLNMS